MAITRTDKIPGVRTNFASGSFLDSAATPEAMVLTLGFVPRYVMVLNETDGLMVEWYDDMAATNTKKTGADGAITLATDSAIVVDEDAMTVTFLKALTVQNKQYRWIALG